MSTRITAYIELLKTCIGRKNAQEALRIVEDICLYYDEQMSAAEQDLAVEKAFENEYGLIVFLRRTLSFNKLFKDSNVKLFTLYISLIDRHCKKIIKYVREISKLMVDYINSSSVSAKEKEMAVLVLQAIMKNEIFFDVNMSELIRNLINIFNVMSAPPARFLHNLFELIGLITKHMPGALMGEQDLLIRDMYFNSLEAALLNQQQVSSIVLKGAMQGFIYYLINFPPQDEPNTCQRIYACVKKLSDPGDIKDRTPFRTALNLLAVHGKIISEQLFKDNQYWHNILLQWMQSNSWEDRKTAIYAFHSFHCEIAKQILIRRNNDDKNVLKFFLNYFKTILQSQKSQSYEVRIAIRGFGVMAGPCKTLLDPVYLDDLLTLVMRRTEYTAIEPHSQNKDTLEHYPDFVQALSQIMEHINELTGIQINSLQNIIIALFQNFFYLSSAHHELTVTSLLLTFLNLSKLDGLVLDDVLEKVMLQGVIWTCSHKSVYDEIPHDTEYAWKENITYEKFLPLWNGLLADVEYADFDRPKIKRKVYQHFMQSLFIILDKLDLSTKKRVFKDDNGDDLELYFCDPEYDLVPVKPKDFHIFFNVVNFYKDVLLAQTIVSHMVNFQYFLKQFFEKIILKSIKYPMVSGFLKLIETGMRISDKIGYFNADTRDQHEDISNYVSYFIKDLLLKTKNESGELQIACLRVIFSVPTDLLTQYLQDLSAVFVIGFDVGKSLWFMANMALNSLEKICNTLNHNSHDMQILLKTVLPCLDTYLQSNEQLDDNRIDVKIVQSRWRRKAKKSFRPDCGDSELLQIKKKILLFLGSLEPNNCLYVTNSAVQNLTKLDIEQNIRLSLHYSDMKPTIYLDLLIPRICQLATTSSNRKTKITACELVHAICLYLIGTNNNRNNVWAKLCDCMLVLGCDGDVAVQQMFEPLLLQVMHYMSQFEHILSSGVEILFDCLMDGISHRTNSAVRDLSARLLREFLVWSIKQSTPANVTECTNQLLSKVKLYCFDSSQFRRQGAVLAFNNLYRVIREDDVILNKFWLDFLHAISMNFIMTEEFDRRYGENNYDQLSTCLDHFVKVIRERKQMFNAVNDERLTPFEFGGNTLKHALMWLFRQCSGRQINFRIKCIDIIKKLSPCVTDCNSTKSFILNTQTIETILEMCEGTPTGTGILARPNLEHLKNSNQSPIVIVQIWLEQLLATLDCIIWLIGDGLIPDIKTYLGQSAVFKVITYYLNKVCFSSVLEIFSAIDSDILNETSDSFRLKIGFETVDRIESIRTLLIMRIIEFLIATLPTCHQFYPPEFWPRNVCLTNVIVKAIFTPQDLGFDFKSKSIMSKLPQLVQSVLELMYKLCPPIFMESLNIVISSEFKERSARMIETAEMQLHCDKISPHHLNSVRGIELYCRQFARFNFKTNLNAIRLFQALFDGLVEKRLNDYYPIYPALDVKEYANILIHICFFYSNIFDCVFDLMLNDKPLKLMNSSANTITHGQHFVEIYKHRIFEYLLRSIDRTIEQLIAKVTTQNVNYVCKLFIDLAQYIYKYRQCDVDSLRRVVKKLLQLWPDMLSKLNPNCSVTAFVLIELMSHIALICPFQLSDISTLTMGLERWIVDILRAKDKSLELKSRAVFLLPCLVGIDHKEHEAVTAALESLQSDYFPLKSKELAAGSLERSGFVNIFQTILDALAASRSPLILRFLINATAADDKHILEYQIQTSLTQFMAKQCVAEQADILEIPYQLFCNTSLEPSIRLAVMKRFVLTMIRGSYVDAILLFYIRHIKDVVDMAGKNYGIASGGWDVEHALTSRIGAYQLIEILMGAVSKQLIEEKLTVALFGAQKQTSIIGYITKKAHSTRSEIFVSDDSTAAELFRIYQCSAFKAMCALICNTQTSINFYEKLLFKENPSKNEFIWQKMINCQNNDLYSNFPVDFENYPKIKEKMVSIRANGNNCRPTEKPKYIQSQSVFESSLSQDITKMDLSMSAIRTSGEVATLENRQQTLFVNLEKSSLNDHEIMAMMCAVVNHMFENKITTFSDDPRLNRKAPVWMEYIGQTIADSRQHKNIRLFLTKLVENCRKWFGQYARYMTLPILQVLNDECAGTTLNHFVIDLSVMLLEWNDVYSIETLEEINVASSFLKFLMNNAWNERKDIFKQNLEIIKNFVEIWRSIIILPKQFLFNSLNVSHALDSRNNLVGIQLNAIVLANKLIPWTDTTINTYIRSLLMCFENQYTAIYQPASQLLGMCLAVVYPPPETTSVSDGDEIYQEIIETIRKKKRDEKKFTDIIFGIHKNFAAIVDPFLVVLSNYIPKSSGAIKRIYLEMFLSRMDIYGTEVCREMLAIGIVALLKSTEYQLISLHIINKALPKMSDVEIKSIVDDIKTFVHSNKVDCRDIMYEIFMFICQNAGDPELQHQAATLLLIGLNDVDSQIQTRLFNFWSEKRLSQKLDNRIIELFGNLYDPESEKHFLSYATQLLLEPAIQSTDSKRQVFEHQVLGEEKLQEFDINVNWRTRNSKFSSPLFVESQQKSLCTINSDIASTLKLRATQTQLAFEPTQDPTQLSHTQNNFSLQTQSSLLFADTPQLLDRRSRKLVVMSSSESDGPGKSFSKLRERFLRDKDMIRREQAINAIERHGYKSVLQNQAKSRKERQVTLYRRYRFGEYPDLMINSLALLLPLKGLVKRDNILARQVLVSIIDGVFKELGPLSNTFITSISQSIQNILTRCRSCEPTVFSALIEIVLINSKRFDLAPDVVATVAQSNNQMAIGILYLESRLASDWDTTNLTKFTTSTIDEDTKYWLKLSEMYRALAEHDVVASIFSDKLNVDRKIPQAIEFELENNFAKAQQLYWEIIEREIAVEKDFAYQSYYKCFEYLGDWTALSNSVTKQVDSFDDLWSDDWNQENLLPHIMKSQLRQIIDGDAHSKDFLNILETWIRSPDKSDYLKINFGEELMMLHMAHEDYKSARYHSEQHMVAFMAEWSNLNVLSHKVRASKILNVRNVAEIHNYAKILDANFNEAMIQTIVNRWTNSQPHNSDSLQLWDAIIAYRTYISALILANFPNDAQLEATMNQSIRELNMKFLDIVLAQGNHKLSDKVIQQLSAHVANADDSFKLEWNLFRTKHQLVKAKFKTTSLSKLNTYLKCWQLINDNVINSMTINQHCDVHAKALNGISEFSKVIFDILPEIDSISDESQRKIFDFTSASTKKNINERLYDNALKCLEKSALICEASRSLQLNESSFDQNACKAIGDAYDKIAEFCFDYAGCERLKNINHIDETTTIIQSVLKAMQYGSVEARKQFPRLLQLPNLNDNPELARVFIDEASNVPEWMFLGWIPQIISVLDFKNECFLDTLVCRISLAYPAAIFYPFHLSYEQFAQTHIDTIEKGAILEILENIKSSIAEKFVGALKNVCLPEKMLQYHLMRLARNVEESNDYNNLKFYKQVKNIINIVFPRNDHQLMQGKAFEKIQQIKNTVKNLTSFDVLADKLEICLNIKNIIQRISATHTSVTKLQDLSPWLQHFHWCGSEEFIEMPGQYTGDCRPNLQDHVKIFKIQEKIHVFQTLRRPIKLNICGSDGKTYSFLFKYGEDLRQDQRIQQLLSLMSDQLKNDKNCLNHNLSIKTYKVITINGYCGMLSFVENTMSMSQLIKNCLNRRENDAMEKINAIRNEYREFIAFPSRDQAQQNFVHLYGRATLYYSRERIMTKFNELSYKLPDEILRFALIDLSVSPETFFALRNNFATSLAALNVAHWLLGIGDRNLSNIMLCTNSGNVVGIDFGSAFGTATHDQAAPELVPFRLTPHMVSALNPLGVSGLVHKGMYHALRTFRQERKLLMACLEVFVKEPTIDWLESVKYNDDGASSSSSENNWKPEMRINNVLRKLCGINPKIIFIEELQSGFISRFPDYADAYIRLLQGHVQHNDRAKLADHSLSVDEQIRCLIDMAIDPALLGVTYEGLATWI